MAVEQTSGAAWAACRAGRYDQERTYGEETRREIIQPKVTQGRFASLPENNNYILLIPQLLHRKEEILKT